jgi:hypothetical protein
VRNLLKIVFLGVGEWGWRKRKKIAFYLYV